MHSFFTSVFRDVGLQDPGWAMTCLSTEAAIGFLCMHDKGTENSLEDLTTCHTDHQENFLPPFLFLFVLFN